MRRDEVLRVLSKHRTELAERFNVRSLALFGSIARDEATEASDVDVLVDFLSPPGFEGYMNLKFRLEELLGCSVDLVMQSALKSEARPIIEQESVVVP